LLMEPMRNRHAQPAFGVPPVAKLSLLRIEEIPSAAVGDWGSFSQVFNRPRHKMLVALSTFLLITFAAIWEALCFVAWLSILRSRKRLRALFAVLDAATPEPSDSDCEDLSNEEGASAVADSAD